METHKPVSRMPKQAEDDPYRNPKFASPRKGLTIGFVVTIVLEFLVGWGGNRTQYVPKPVVKEQDAVVVIVMPKLEPDPSDEIAPDTPQPEASDEPAPPMQTDVPQIARPDAFIQQIEPPPPDTSELSKHVVKIPTNRSSFGGFTVLDISQLDQEPRAKFQARPVYPFEMIRLGYSGEVIVDFIVDTSGNVRNAYVARSSRRDFEDSAVTAVEKWKFTPGRKGAHAVYTHMQVPVRFNLQKQIAEDSGK